MKKTAAETAGKKKSIHSKGFTEGINALYDEIQLAFQWHRPSILLAIHKTPGGQTIAQQFLEKRLSESNRKTQYIPADKDNPDVINTVRSIPNHEKMVFFISGLDRANQLSEGSVYRALNMHREHLVEQKICAVFWLTEMEAANLPRFAPDFWAFRHRVIEFAPQRGPRNPSIPSGLFLWKESLPSIDLREQITHYENLLSQLPDESSTTTARLDITFKLIQLNWQLNNLENFSKQFNNLLSILEKSSSHSRDRSWTLNIQGIKLFEEGDRQGARTCFKHALEVQPNNSLFAMNDAIATHGIGKNREALLVANRAIKADPDDIRLQHVLGLLYLSVGQLQKAVETLETAAQKEPNNLDIQYSLAICYSKNNQLEECASLLSKIGSTSGKSILQLACHDILSGNIETALVTLRQALNTKEIHEHQLWRDPNIRALLDIQTLTSISS
jgi:tetratricopeptide (TPR) repeat protein